MLLGADGSGQGWATLGYGSDDMAVLNENMAMESREIGWWVEVGVQRGEGERQSGGKRVGGE